MTFSEFIQAAIAFFQGTLTGAEKTLLICCIGLAIEHFRPTDKDQPASSILFNLIWLLNFLVVSNFIMIYAGKVIGPTVAALGGPLFKLNLPEVWWTPIVHVSIFLLMYDFGYYCFHRCQHTWRWFWCHHKLALCYGSLPTMPLVGKCLPNSFHFCTNGMVGRDP